jgi:DNA invertase Pin-like site-specific DNA recombinase
MLIGYARVSKADGSQALDLQIDALKKAGVKANHIYQDKASGKHDDRPGLVACLKALRKGDLLIVWKLDRLGRDLRHLVNTIQELLDKGVGFKVLAGQGAEINTTTASGKLVFGIFAALAEFERELIRERTIAGLAAARARGRKGGRKFSLTKAQVRLAQVAMGKKETVVGDLCKELGITRPTIYRYVGPDGKIREYGKRVLGRAE